MPSSLPSRLRTSFVTGLVLVAPLAVTAFVLHFVFTRVTAVLRPVVKQVGPLVSQTLNYPGDVVFVAQVLSALLVVGFVTLLGYLASKSAGRRLFGGLERAVSLVPLVRTIYFGVRQVGESLSERSSRYDDVVLVEHPREGLFSVGFVTNRAPRATRRAAERDLYSVFLPNSPNPTAGRLVLVDDADVYELDMSVSRALRLLVTTGLTEEQLAEGELTDLVDGPTPGSQPPEADDAERRHGGQEEL